MHHNEVDEGMSIVYKTLEAGSEKLKCFSKCSAWGGQCLMDSADTLDIVKIQNNDLKQGGN